MNKQKLDEQQDYSNPDLLQKALHQLLEQISKRDQKIAWLNAKNAAALQAFVERERSMLVEISERDAILFYTQAQLEERISQLDEIANSRTWRIALLLQRIRVFLLPPESRRARVLRQGLNFILFPFKKIRRK